MTIETSLIARPNHTPQTIRIFAVDVNVLPPEYYITKKVVSISSVVHDIIRRSLADVFRDFYGHRNRIVCVAYLRPIIL